MGRPPDRFFRATYARHLITENKTAASARSGPGFRDPEVTLDSQLFWNQRIKVYGKRGRARLCDYFSGSANYYE
jgi:hypothetical protein